MLGYGANAQPFFLEWALYLIQDIDDVFNQGFFAP